MNLTDHIIETYLETNITAVKVNEPTTDRSYLPPVFLGLLILSFASVVIFFYFRPFKNRRQDFPSWTSGLTVNIAYHD